MRRLYGRDIGAELGSIATSLLQGLSVNSSALELGCDASNATG
jgi:hypothetical protein